MKKIKSKTAVKDAPAQQSNPDRTPVNGQAPMADDTGALAYEHKRVAYGLVRRDPEQPRRVFAEGALQELADSIREQGILQDLILEFKPAKYTIREPDLHSGGMWTLWNNETKEPDFQGSENHCYLHVGPEAAELKDGYVIVCGERRWRAAGIVGLSELPAKVYTGLTPKQRFGFQMIENLQRENLSALENAEALAKKLAERQKEDTTFKPEELARELGKGRAWIYEQLKLTRLHGPVREALAAGKISMSVAGVVAIVPLPNQQEKLLKVITNEDDWRHPFSVADVEELVDEAYVKQLSEAPFKQTDPFNWHDKFPEDTNNHGEVNTCVACPHRSGNLAATFPELAKRPNICTRPDCFGLKCKAHWINEATAAELKGKKVMATAEFNRVKKDYIAGGKEQWWGDQHGTFESMMGKHKPEPVLVATPKGLEKFYPKDEGVAAAKKNGHTIKLGNEAAQTPEEKAKEKEKRDAVQKLHESRRALPHLLVEQAAQGLRKVKDSEAWALLESNMEDRSYHDFTKALNKHCKTERDRVLAQCLTSRLTRVSDWNTGKWDKEALALWASLGIDLEAEETKRAAKPELALKAKAPEQGKLLDVKKNKKKGKKA